MLATFARVRGDILRREGEGVVVAVDRSDGLVDRRAGDGRHDLLRGEIEGLETVGVQEDLELARRPAVHLDVGDTGDALQQRA